MNFLTVTRKAGLSILATTGLDRTFQVPVQVPVQRLVPAHRQALAVLVVRLQHRPVQVRVQQQHYNGTRKYRYTFFKS